jgi:hypothetical protein
MGFRIKATVALTTALPAFGCSDQSLSRNPTAPESAAVSSGSLGDREALSELTRVVALALQDAELRQRVKNDMRASRFTTEHKLPFRHYLHGESGGNLLSAMATESGRTRAQISALLDRLPPLEFYMPVRQHRENWSGGPDLIIAATLDEAGTTLVGHDLAGQSLVLSITRAPETPTLVLVPIETDFSSPLPASRYINTNDAGGVTIGTYAPFATQSQFRSSVATQSECDPTTAVIECNGDNGGSPVDWSIPSHAPRGLYMTALELYDYKEPWIKGDPEIEVIVLGPAPSDPADHARVISCAGETRTGWRYFDQNSHQSFAKVLLLTQQQIEHYRFDEAALDSRKFEILVIEDDYAACEIVMDANHYRQKGEDFVLSGLAAALSLGCFLDPYDRQRAGFQCLAVFVGSALRTLFSLEALVSTRDDDLGTAINRAQVPQQQTAWYATHALLISSSISNGGMRLTYHVQPQ